MASLKELAQRHTERILAGPALKPPGRRALEAQARAEAAAKRAEIRRLHRELFPPEAAPAPLSLDEQLEALRAAVAARKSGDTRPAKALIAEADAAVREKRPPPRER